MNAVVGEHGVDAVRHCLEGSFKEAGGGGHVGAIEQLDEGELRRTVDGHEQVELAFGIAQLGDIHVEEANRVAAELLFGQLVAFHFKQPSDAGRSGSGARRSGAALEP